MLFLAAIIAVAIIYTFPKKHTFTVKGIIYQLGEENRNFEKSTSIHVDGKMKRNLLGVRTFTGFINIEGLDIPVPEKYRKLSLKFGKYGHAHILYTYFENGMPKHYAGEIYINQDFSHSTFAA